MGKRTLPVDPPPMPVRVLLSIAGVACFLVGGLWVLLFLGMLFFGGLDWREEVANGMGFQGPVILGLATLGIIWFVGGRALMDRASGRRRRPVDPQTPSHDGW